MKDNIILLCSSLSAIILCLLFLFTVKFAHSTLSYLKKIYKLLRLKKPGLVFLVYEEGEEGMLKFVLVLPEAGAADVVTRELRFTVGEELFEVNLEGSALETMEMTGADNDAVAGTLVDVDDVGNRSEAREFSFVLVDTLAPPQPGELGLKVTGEE